MAHNIDYVASENGALAAIPGNTLKVLIVYLARANIKGHTWASTNPRAPRALDKGTGLAHNTIREGRKWLKNHGVIYRVSREEIENGYENIPYKPPARVVVWGLTGIIRPCCDPACDCHKHLSGTVVLLHDAGQQSSKSDDNEKPTSSKIDDQPEPTKSSKIDDDPILGDPVLDHRDKSLYRPLRATLFEVCGMREEYPPDKGQVNKAASYLYKGGYTPEDVRAFVGVFPRLVTDVWRKKWDGQPPKPGAIAKFIEDGLRLAAPVVTDLVSEEIPDPSDINEADMARRADLLEQLKERIE